MSVEAVPRAKFSVDASDGTTKVVILRRRQWLPLAFLTCWLGGWAVGEVSAIGALLGFSEKSPSIFLVFWLGGWTVGGCCALWAWFQMLSGREQLRVGQRILEVQNGSNPFQPTKEYDLNEVHNLRICTAWPSAHSGQDFWQGGMPALKFDYGAATIGFGRGLSEAEAGQLIQTLRTLHPTLLADRTGQASHEHYKLPVSQ